MGQKKLAWLRYIWQSPTNRMHKVIRESIVDTILKLPLGSFCAEAYFYLVPWPLLALLKQRSLKIKK